MAAERLSMVVLRTYTIRTSGRHTIGVLVAIDQHLQTWVI